MTCDVMSIAGDRVKLITSPYVETWFLERGGTSYRLRVCLTGYRGVTSK